METQKGTTQSLTQAVGQLDRLRGKQVRKLATIRTLWVGLLLLLLCFYLDAAIDLSGRYRMTINSLLLAALCLTWGVTVLRLNRSSSRTRMLARVVEGEYPELHNELINAVDFEEQLQAGPRTKVSTALMHRQIERALDSFSDVEEVRSLRPPSLQRESRLLIGLLATWLLCGILLTHWFLAEWPRFLQPWADHPPYCATRFTLEPAGAVVEYGKDLKVQVTTAGQIPEELWLIVEDPNDGSLNRVGMFSTDEGTFHQTVEDIRSDLVYYASVERGRSRRYPITLSKIPRIESVEVRYRYPGYTQLPDRTTSLSDYRRIVKGYRDTEVTLTVTSNRPLQGGLVTAGENAVACTAFQENSVRASFALSQPGPFQIKITDREGYESTELFEGEIQLVPDGKPMIAIVSPGMQSLAIPSAKVPIVIEAHDDLGVGGVSLYRAFNESDDSCRVLYTAQRVETTVQVEQTLDLADLGVRPGDVIDYYAMATDSQPAAPQTVTSEPYQIRIISDEQFSQMMQDEMTAEDLRMKYDTILAELSELIQKQRALEGETQELLQGVQDSNSLTPSAQSRLDELIQQQSNLAQRTEELAAKLREEAENPAVFDIEKDYKKSLSQMADQLLQAAGHMNNSANEMTSGRQPASSCASKLGLANQEQEKALAAMGEQTKAMREAIQQANRELDKMMDLIQDVETFKQLYLAQKHLTRQVKSLRDTETEDLESKVRFKELAERELFIKETLQQLAKDLCTHGDAVEEEYPKVTVDAYTIASEIERREIPERMQEGSVFLNQGRGPQAYPKVQEALEQMEAMISFCKGAGNGACKQCEFRLKIKMSLNPGNTMAQLSQGLNMGMGMGLGQVGAMGRGSSGFAGGQSNIALFGNDTFGKNTMRDSSLAGGNRRDAEAFSAPQMPNPLAGNIEALTPQEKRDLEMEVKGEGRMMAEYRTMIEAYFQRLAEEK